VLVTEGYMDVVALAQLGFPNAVATLGTACTPEHVQKLFRFTDSVVFSFDGDAAGRRAARKALDGALPYATDVRSHQVPVPAGGARPGQLHPRIRREAFARFVAEATPLSRFLIEAAREGCDLTTAEGRAHMAATPSRSGSCHARRRPQAAAAGRDRRGRAARRIGPRRACGPAGPQGRPRPAPAERRSRTDVRLPPRAPIASRRKFPRASEAGKFPSAAADHAARPTLLLVEEPGLGPADQRRPCGAVRLPGPHGPLFAWLDSQCTSMGRCLGGAARGMQGQPVAELAERLMADVSQRLPRHEGRGGWPSCGICSTA
jgi:DNA primase